MIVIIDVDYRKNNTAKATGVILNDFSSKEPLAVVNSYIENVEPYESGNFYKRELPCIRALFKEHKLKPLVTIIDGYCELKGHKTLGEYVAEELTDKIVIGIAKNKHIDDEKSEKVYRGTSKKPLYVTHSHSKESTLGDLIEEMAGKYRIPNMIKRADAECRSDKNDRTGN